MTVKKSALILCAVVAASITAPAVPVFAENNTAGSYPTNFSKTWDDIVLNGAVSDFTIGENGIAFSCGNALYIFSGEYSSTDEEKPAGTLTKQEHSATIISVEYADEYFIKDETGAVYSASDLSSPASQNVTFKESLGYLKTDTCYYVTDSEGKLYYYTDSPTNSTPVEKDGENLKHLKDYSGAYALTDGAIYSLSGGQADKINFRYVDYSDTQGIAVGNITELLKTKSAKNATLKAGAFVSAFDIDALASQNLQDNPNFAVTSTREAPQNAPCTLLYSGGGLAIIVVGNSAYLTSPDSIENVTELNKEQCDFNAATALWDTGVYFQPYASPALSAGQLAQSEKVSVKGLIRNEAAGLNFYEIEFTRGDETLTGYALSNFLSAVYIQDNPPPTVNEDENKTDTNIKPVVLILIVVALVIIAIVYLTFVATGAAGKKDRKNNKNSPDGKK